MAKPPRILDLAFAVRGLPGPVMLLLINMARLGNKSGEVFASQETLAAMCGCSDRSIRRCLARLSALGFITRIPNPGRSTVRYRLNFGRWGREPGSADQDGGPKRPAAGGHAVRQNPNQNQKVNQPGGQRISSRSSDTASLDWVDDVTDPLLKRIGVLKGFLPAPLG